MYRIKRKETTVDEKKAEESEHSVFCQKMVTTHISWIQAENLCYDILGERERLKGRLEQDWWTLNTELRL